MLRRLRFFLLERVVLPLAIFPFKLLVRSWRLIPPEAEAVRRVVQTPRILLATYHGMLLHLVAFARLIEGEDRKLVVMLSPSLDGRLLAAFLSRFGIEHVRASTRRRGISGSRELVRRLGEGDIAVIAVDGPRGPCCVAHPGFRRVAAAAHARVALLATSADRGVTFGSWDRAHLPLPFARVELAIELDANGDDLERRLLAAAQRLRSPVVPPEMTLAPQAGSELDMDSSPPR